MKYFKVILILFFVSFAAKNSFACMCGNTGVREAFLSADAVLTAKVIKIEYPELKLSEDQSEIKTLGNQRVTLSLIKKFKGNVNEKVILTQENSTCDWQFDEDKDLNQKLLLYLYKRKDKTYSIISCSRSSQLDNAFDDLSWLTKLPKSLKRNRISGTVRYITGDRLFPPLSNIKIEITGDKDVYNLITDKNGFYEIWDLPEGKYKVKAEISDEFSLIWTNNIIDNWTFYWEHFDSDKKALEFLLDNTATGGIDFMLERKKNEN